MRFVRSVAALAAALVILGATAGLTVGATTVAECQAQLAALEADTRLAETQFANAKSFTGAVAKLEAAAEKLSIGKTADAAAKVADFRSNLEALATAPQPKVDPATAQELIADAAAVEACIASIAP